MGEMRWAGHVKDRGTEREREEDREGERAK